MSKDEEKINQQTAMTLLACLAVEHGLRLHAAGDSLRKVVEGDIKIARGDGEYAIKKRYTEAKRRRIDHQVGQQINAGSTAMLYLAKLKNPHVWLLSNVFSCLTEAACLAGECDQEGPSLKGYNERNHEYLWQKENLFPLVERCFNEPGAAVINDIKKVCIREEEA